MSLSEISVPSFTFAYVKSPIGINLSRTNWHISFDKNKN